MPGTDLGGSAPIVQPISPETARALRRETSVDVDEKAVGESLAFCDLQSRIARIRNAAGNVIVAGERGVGKELAARALRKRMGAPDEEPFQAIDSSTVHGGTAESILFGHERGAFTGATSSREGLFERANGGIVYFDEIANMSMNIQAKLLRVIQEQEVVRIGASSARKLSFRVVCATNKDLEEECRRGEFRRDLLDRLGVFMMRVPPLRERRSDVGLLVDHFLRRHAAPGRRYVVTDAVWEILAQYDWPGNVRELSNVVEYAATLCDGDKLLPRHLPAKILASRTEAMASRRTGEASSGCERSALLGAPQAAPWQPRDIEAAEVATETDTSFHASMKAYERILLLLAFQREDGNVARMARRLGLSRSHAYNKLREHGIEAPESNEWQDLRCVDGLRLGSAQEALSS